MSITVHGKMWMKKYYLIPLLVCQFASGVVLASTEFTASNIRIEGLHRISKDAVLQVMPVHAGQTVTPENAAEIVRAIFKTGFFKNVVLDRDNNTLIIKLTERPTIGKFELLGIKSKEPIEKILKETNLAEGRIYDPTALARAEQDIERYYLSKGNYSVKVNSKVTQEDRNRVAVTLSIYTGDEAKIKKINITGNVAFKEKELIKQLLHAKTSWTSWFTKDDRYAKEKHAAELELLQSYYLDRGYVNFQVDSSQVSLSTDKKDVYITINVSEGEKYYFGDISITGKLIVPKEELQKIVDKKIQKGMVFSKKSLLEVQKALEMCLGNHGYGNAQARLNVDNDDINKKMNIEFFMEPGIRITVRRINIVGNRLTQDIVLRRGIEQMEGSWISNQKIQEGKEYILREGYGGNVEVENKPVLGKNDQVDVLYKMEEQRTAQLSGGVAYSASEKLALTLGASFPNFLGTGKNVDFGFEKSKVSQAYNFGYFNPFFTDDGIGMGYNLYHRKVDISKTSQVFEYALNSFGGDINWSLPLSRYDYFVFGVGYDKSELKLDMGATSATPDEARAFVTKQGTKFTEYNVSMGWKHRSLDQYIFPTKGSKQGIMFKTSLPNSTSKYYSVSCDTSWFYPVGDDYVVNLAGDLGYSASYKKKQYFPFFRHYYAGGADSIRGFAERSLGPLDSKGHPFGGNILIEGKASFIFPPPFISDAKNIRTALFLDGGQVYDTNYKYFYDSGTGNELARKARNSHGLKYSVGVSLTWFTPMGIPFIISLANPINAKKTDSKRKFAFSFGTLF